MARVTKVYGDTQLVKDIGTEAIKRELKALSGAFVQLSNLYGAAQSDVINIAADWAAAGSSGVNLASSTELSLKAMVLGEMDATKATKALISIQAQYGLTTGQLSDTLAYLNMVENQTGISMQGLIEGFDRTAGVARNAQIGTRQLAAMLAALVPAAGSASNAGNGLRTIISRMLAPTKEARDVLHQMNIEVTDSVWRNMSAIQRLDLVSKKFQNLTVDQKAMASAAIASRWQINKFDILMKALVNTNSYYAKAMQATADKHKVLAQAETELNTVLQSSPQRWQQLGVIMQNTAQQVITPLIPVILGIGNQIAQLGMAFSNLPPGLQMAIVSLLLFIAVIGPIGKYIGSTITLLHLLGAAFVWPIKAIRALAVWLSFARAAEGENATGLRRMAEEARASAGVMWSAVGKFYQSLWAMFKGTAFYAQMRLIMLGMVGMFRFGMVLLLGAAQRGFSALLTVAQGAMLKLLPIIVTAFSAIPSLLGRAWGAIAVGMTRLGVELQLASVTVLSSLRLLWVKGGLLIQTGFQKAMALAATGMAGLGRLLTGLSLRILGGLQALWTAYGSKIGRGFVSGFMLIPKAIGFAFSGIWAVTKVGMYGMWLIVSGGVKRIALWLGRGLLAAFTGPWGLVIIAVLALVAIFHKQLGQLFGRIRDRIVMAWHDAIASIGGEGSFLGKVIQTIKNLFWSMPFQIQAALRAVVQVVSSAVKTVYLWLQYLNPFAKHSPSLVDEILRGVAVMTDSFKGLSGIQKPIAASVRQIAWLKREANSFLVSIEKSKRADQLANIVAFAPKAVPAFKALVNTVDVLNQKLTRLNAMVATQQAIVDKWQAKVDLVNKALEQQEAVLANLQATADGYAKIIDDAQNRISQLSNAPLVGMGDMQDAIHANEMEMKKLQLAMMDMRDAGFNMEDAANKAALLAGEMEKIGGARVAMRAKGAGQDILGFYDTEMQKLQDQRDQIAMQGDEYTQLGNALNELQKKADRLDLEKALKFDDLTYQIQKLASSEKELTFDQVTSGIKSAQAEVAKYTPLLEQANKAIADQQAIVDALTVRRDQYQKGLDRETARLDVLKKQYDDVKNAISDATQALNDLIQATDDAASKGKKGKAPTAIEQAFKGGGKVINQKDVGIGRLTRKEETPQIKDFGKLAADKVAAGMGEFGIMAPFKKGIDRFHNWFAKNIKPAWGPLKKQAAELNQGIDWSAPVKKISDFFGKVATKAREFWGWLQKVGGFLSRLFGPDIQRIITNFTAAWQPFKDQLAQLKPIFDSMKPTLAAFWKGLKVVGFIIGGVLLVVLKVLFTLLSHLIGPLMKALGSTIVNTFRLLAGVAEVIMGIFAGFTTGDFSGVARGFAKIGQALWDMLGSLETLARDALIAVLKTIGNVIIDFINAIFKTDIPSVDDMITAIKDAFMGLPGKLKDAGKRIWDAIKSIFMQIWNWLVGKSLIPDLINEIVRIFASLPDRARNALGSLKDKITAIFWSVWTWITTQFKLSWDGIKTIFTNPVQAAKNIFNNTLGRSGTIRNIFNAVRDWVKNTWKKGWDGIKRVFTDPIGAAKAAINKLFDSKTGLRKVFNDAVSALGSAWDKLRDKMKTPIKGVVDILNLGVVDKFNWVVDHLKLPGGLRLDRIPYPKWAGYEGGTPSSVNNRKPIPAELHANEHVWTAREVRAAGGHGALIAMRQAALKGQLPKFFLGGGVRPVVGGPANRHETGYPWAIWAGDFPAPKGTPIRAWTDGVVASVKRWTYSYGQHTRINHPGSHNTLYAHQSQIGVTPGQQVRMGQTIGQVGDTGHAFGTHLHFELAGGAAGINMTDTGGAVKTIKDLFPWLGKFKDIGSYLKSKIEEAMAGPLRDFSASGLGALVRGVPQALMDSIVAKVKGFAGKIPGLARGGAAKSGLALLGENGPELANLRGGTRVFDSRRSSAMLADQFSAAMQRAFTAGMNRATGGMEDTVTAVLGRAIARAERRIDAVTRPDTVQSNTTANTRTVVIQNASFPSVKTGEDAQAFLDNLVAVTSGTK
jgi:TP901 family phage tail tape measure protein